MEKVQHGYYSETQKRISGSIIYLDNHGNEKLVTEVSYRDPDNFSSGHGDMVYVGIVTKFCRQNFRRDKIFTDYQLNKYSINSSYYPAHAYGPRLIFQLPYSSPLRKGKSQKQLSEQKSGTNSKYDFEIEI